MQKMAKAGKRESLVSASAGLAGCAINIGGYPLAKAEKFVSMQWRRRYRVCSEAAFIGVSVREENNGWPARRRKSAYPYGSASRNGAANVSSVNIGLMPAAYV